MVRIKYRFNNNIETIILYNLDYHVIKYNEYFIAIDYTFDYFKHAKLNISISINDDTEVYKLCIHTYKWYNSRYISSRPTVYA